MTDKTQCNQDSSMSTLTKKEKERAYRKAYREANKEKVLAQERKDRHKNKTKRKSYQKAYQKSNKEKRKKYRKTYAENNKDKLAAQGREYRQRNKERINQRSRERRAETNKKLTKQVKVGRPLRQDDTVDSKVLHKRNYFRSYNNKRRSQDPFYKVQCNMRTLGNRVVKLLSLGKKPAKTEQWQGCTADKLKAHLESLFQEGMTWENYGRHGWHIDHIRPVSSFKPEEWEQINHYTNLQPLWAEDNLSKSNKYEQKEEKTQSLDL